MELSVQIVRGCLKPQLYSLAEAHMDSCGHHGCLAVFKPQLYSLAEAHTGSCRHHGCIVVIIILISSPLAVHLVWTMRSWVSL